MSGDAGPGRLWTVEEAIAGIRSKIPGPLEAESATPEAALGRWLAAPVVATTDLPPWDNSAMDGYAIRAADTAGASVMSPVRLDVVGEVRAGQAPEVEVAARTAVRIATGAPIPPGADAVVPVEATTPLGAGGTPVGPRGGAAVGPLPAACLVHESIAAGGSIRSRGGDVRAGATVLATGRRMTAAAVALAAGVGSVTVSVRRRPRVAVLATGDEVRAMGEALGPAGIPDANGPGLRALVAEAGGEPIGLGVARDELTDVVAAVRRGVAAADVVIVSGGVSVGPYDVVRAAFSTVGMIDLWRVAVQPGKPFAFGVAERPGGGRAVLLFGLPGNPVSTAVTFEIFVRPALALLAGDPEPGRPADRGVLREPVSKSPGRRGFLRVLVERTPAGEVIRDADGRIGVRLAGGQGSHVLSALAAADALAIVPETVTSLPAGADVALWWLGSR
ncbi:MAG: molybdopterin molybdotransferase MoeA [Chloroflexi bacterium]|nr:molybdopterin molybdotransferase MoeA [Chloroflexota bacterium]